MPFVTWLLGTKLGRILLAIGGAAIAVGAAFVKGFLEGKAHERAAEDRAALEAHQDREKKDDEVAKLPDADVDQRLDRWVRHD